MPQPGSVALVLAGAIGATVSPDAGPDIVAVLVVLLHASLLPHASVFDQTEFRFAAWTPVDALGRLFCAVASDAERLKTDVEGWPEGEADCLDVTCEGGAAEKPNRLSNSELGFCVTAADVESLSREPTPEVPRTPDVNWVASGEGNFGPTELPPADFELEEKKPPPMDVDGVI